MAIYSYVKNTRSPWKRILSYLSIIFIFSGISIFVWVLYPIFMFELYYAPRFGTLLSPVPNEIIKQTIGTELSQVLGMEKTDYTKASVWFPKASGVKLAQNISSYHLSIPKLYINSATVKVGGEDLSRNLIHFTGPLPGEIGNPIIFGHSTLLWFYNPKDYKSIFSKLPDLTTNDRIYLTSDNVTYIYKVFEMKITTPNDLSVLNQTNDGSYLTLITCVPPGTYLRRFIVKAKLEKI